MKKSLLICFFGLVSFLGNLKAEEISGYWKMIDRHSGRPACIIAIYEYKERLYGRIIGTYNFLGKVDDNIYHPKTRAAGVVGNPYFCGMDIIWNLHRRGSKYKGKILDPVKGNVYDAILWIHEGNLIVRGEYLFFGRNEMCVPVEEQDFSMDFKKPNLNEFVPSIPQID